MIGYIVVVIISIALIYWNWFSEYSYISSIVKQYPSPKSYPIIGNALFLISNSKQDLDKKFLELCAKMGGLFSFKVGPQVSIVISDPKVLEIVLTSNKLITKSIFYDFVTPWLGDGLLLSSGQKWHSRRKAITPAFHFKILDEFLTVFNQQGDVLINAMKKLPMEKSFDVFSYITKYTLDVICETAMGIKVNAMVDEHSEYPSALKEMLNIMLNRLMTPWKRFKLLFTIFGWSDKKRQDKLLKILHGFTDQVIRNRREFLIANKDADINEIDEFGLKRRKALLDILLSATIDGKPLTDNDIREEVDTFMFLGHDTTASAISSALYLISRHPDVQAKIFAEIIDVIGTDFNKSMTMSDLNDLKYLDLVIKETLRIYPAVPGIGRRVTEDTYIGDNRILPKGASLFLVFYDTFHNAKYFPEPEKFIPERFLGRDSVEITNLFAYTPFSAGPRNCIGQRFALLEMKSTICKILLNFELLPLGEEPQIIVEAILRSMNGVQIGIKPRKF